MGGAPESSVGSAANRHAPSGACILEEGGSKSAKSARRIIRGLFPHPHIHDVSFEGSSLKLFASASVPGYASVTAAMLVRGQKRVACFLIPFTILVLLTVAFYVQHLVAVPSFLRQWSKDASSTWQDYRQLSSGGPDEPVPQKPLPYQSGNADVDILATHNEVLSASRRDGKYFMIEFGNREAINPNIIPHPTLTETWIIVAMQQKSSVKKTVWYTELVCEATFTNKGSLACRDPPMLLPIAATASPHCTGDLEFFKWNVGPHDGRVFYGPEVPYTIYGSNSAYNCFGQWIQDFRILVDWGHEPDTTPQHFHFPTDLQRPPPYHSVEKNYFIFWSTTGDMYAHYDISPHRSFALLSPDGSVGPDLAPLSSTQDSTCMAQYMPPLAPTLESIHQATNSLSITLCNRTDPSCIPSPTNTFIMSIFQHKTFYRFHSVYEPYILLFDSSPPFAVHGISTKPIWIHGRGKAGETRPKNLRLAKDAPWNQTEMFYVTSMSWKEQGMKYHGFLDDVVFLAFGIEDERTAGIDVRAGDLIRGLGMCSDVGEAGGDIGQNGGDAWGLEGGDVGAGLGDVLG